MGKYKDIWTKIENFKNIELNALPGYDDKCIKTKMRTHDEKVYTYFRGLNVPENEIKCEPFAFIFIDFLLGHEKCFY